MNKLTSGYGQRVRDQRTKRGIEQDQLAEQVGSTQQEISRIETGKIKKINLELLILIAKALEVPPGWLLFGVEGIDNLSSDSFRIARAWDNAPAELKLETTMLLLARQPYDPSLTSQAA